MPDTRVFMGEPQYSNFNFQKFLKNMSLTRLLSYVRERSNFLIGDFIAGEILSWNKDLHKSTVMRKINHPLWGADKNQLLNKSRFIIWTIERTKLIVF